MILAIDSGTNSTLQFFTVVILFVFVLALTYFVTKWLANFQKEKTANNNLEIIEVSKISANKYIEIVRCGEKYLVIAVCKDTVTMLCELSKDEISFKEESTSEPKKFEDYFKRAKTVDVLEKEKDLEKNK